MRQHDETVSFIRSEIWLTDAEMEQLIIDTGGAFDLPVYIMAQFPQTTIISTCLELEDNFHVSCHSVFKTAREHGLTWTKSRYYFEAWGYGSRIGFTGETVEIIEWDNPQAAIILELTGWFDG